MSELIQIEPIVDEIMDDLKARNYSGFKILILFLYKLRPGWEGSFDDIRIHLSKVPTFNNGYSLYLPFKRFIENKLNGDAWEELYSWLAKNGVNREKIKEFQPTYDEKAFMNRLPDSEYFLFILAFYLFNPRLAYKFFIDNPVYSLTEQEQTVILSFRSFPPDLQEKISKDLENISEKIKYSH